MIRLSDDRYDEILESAKAKCKKCSGSIKKCKDKSCDGYAIYDLFKEYDRVLRYIDIMGVNNNRYGGSWESNVKKFSEEFKKLFLENASDVVFPCEDMVAKKYQEKQVHLDIHDKRFWVCQDYMTICNLHDGSMEEKYYYYEDYDFTELVDYFYEEIPKQIERNLK